MKFITMGYTNSASILLLNSIFYRVVVYRGITFARMLVVC